MRANADVILEYKVLKLFVQIFSVSDYIILSLCIINKINIIAARCFNLYRDLGGYKITLRGPLSNSFYIMRSNMSDEIGASGFSCL